MEKFAHETLTLRAFFRQFMGNVPDDYYAFLHGKISKADLISLFPLEYENACNEAWQKELGDGDDAELDRRIEIALHNAKEWILIGGPPCQAYSLVGRSRTGGISSKDKRVRLYEEYLRIIARHAPPVFVMENVKGLLSAKVNQQEIFHQILSDLQNPTLALATTRPDRHYKKHRYKLLSLTSEVFDDNLFEDTPPDFIIRAEEYGVPQKRHRVIIFGMREDIYSEFTYDQLAGVLLNPAAGPTVSTVIGDLPQLRSGLSKHYDDTFEHWAEIISTGMSKQLADQINTELSTKIRNNLDSLKNRKFRGKSRKPKLSGALHEWLHDERLNGNITNHDPRTHMDSDLWRYFYCSSYAQVYGRSPKLEDFPEYLLPDHQSALVRKKNHAFADRFRVQLADQPSTTITSHISKDGHYYIHYDPEQCRSLTVREAARLQTFPDNYFFCGPRTSQYHQVGNAVPPFLAKQLAESVLEILRYS